MKQAEFKEKFETVVEMSAKIEGLCRVLCDAAQINAGENAHMIYGLENLYDEIQKLCDLTDEMSLAFVATR